MVATQVLPTIQEIWEMMNDYFLRTLPPSEEIVRAIEDDVNGAFNGDNAENETIYAYAIQDTDIDEVSTDWLDEYRFATQFVNQYTQQELRTHYDDLASINDLSFTYEDSTPAQKIYCILWNYARANQHVIRLR